MRRPSSPLAVIAVAAVVAASAVAQAKPLPPRWQTLPLPPPMPAPTATGHVDVGGGAKIFYATYGKGTEPVILLHGGLGNADHFGFQLPALVDRYQVIAIDSRGQGRSTLGAKPKLTYHVMATDVLAVMDHLAVDAAALVGWSDGGAIALDLALNHPRRVAKLFVVGTNYHADGSKPRKGPAAKTFNAYAMKCKSDFAKLAKSPRAYAAAIDALLPIWRSTGGFTKDQLRSITIPTVVADGDHDEIIFLDHIKEMALLIPNAKLVVFEDTSHFALWQDPAAFNKALVEFLDAPKQQYATRRRAMPEPGQLIGPYRLIAPLGRGAMGEVWRARDERLDRYVALKVLPPDLAGDPERRVRMLREARAAAAIRHANVVTLFDIVAHDGNDILVMELVEGRTLSDVLRKDGAAPLERGLRWIAGIADALVTAHAKSILHRDIKAANVMVTEADDIKILDFGLAKLLRDTDAVTTLPLAKPPSASATKIALDATMPSSPTSTAELDSYQTHAGQLIGTPLYMAPEQIDGAAPDERSEVFSVGVLAHEVLAGKPPYTATSMDELFRQIQHDDPPALAGVPDSVQAIVRRALAKDPAARFPSMAALRDAVAAERARLFAPRARRWPLYAALALVVAGAAVGLWQWRAHRPAPAKPGDDYVARALDEYEVFYNDKAMSSLRAALRVAPDHPRANAYVLLLGFASDADRALAVEAGKRALPTATGTDAQLLAAALALAERGPQAAAALLAGATDRELRFWKAELDFRASSFDAAAAGYKRLLEDNTTRLRGRIYDHYSFLLLGSDEVAEAKRIGALYRDAFPGEADAVGVYATTLSAAGEHAAAIAAAEEALRLAEGEDTLAGLAKVLAHEFSPASRARAKALYARSLERAGPHRRPLRRAALALLQYLDGELETARATVAPCLARTRAADPASASGLESEATVRERGACLFIAGILDPQDAEPIAQQLDALAAEATDLRPAYGAPASLATLLRARAGFFGGACLVDVAEGTPPANDEAYRVPLDYYVAYHVPYFATWTACEDAARLATTGDLTAAIQRLREQPNSWSQLRMKQYENRP